MKEMRWSLAELHADTKITTTVEIQQLTTAQHNL